MGKKIRIGFVGCGSFCRHFVPLFQAHPSVEFVAVCDLIPERAQEYDRLFNVDKIFDSYEQMLDSDELNAIAIFTQRHLHGPMAIAALKAGKHVYSAVPMASHISEIEEIVALVKKTGLTYSMGETGHYRPCSIFCRQKLASGEMGDFVYAEAQYNHDMIHFYEPFKHSGGENWRQVAGIPPMLYPTHSTAMVLSAADSYVTRLAAFGYEEKQDNDIFGRNGVNLWNNPYSNTSALMLLANGGIARISENRRIAWYNPMSYITCFHGTKSSYECSMAQHSYVKLVGEKAIFEDVSDFLNPDQVTQHRNQADFGNMFVNGAWGNGMAPIQSLDRLPEEIHSLPTGHGGTHKYMVDDFCRAFTTGRLSPTNAWRAAQYNIPGLIAHQSAMQGGVTLDVPSLGEPPSDWEVLPSDMLAAYERI
ncbi:MAG: Gfo/Idh/MocA family protein [Christensenellales bacterium]|jgi:predicted dehydrogenase